MNLLLRLRAGLSKRRATRVTIVCLLSVLPVCSASLPAQKITEVIHGPLRVEGNRLLDARGHSVLLRGTQLPDFTLARAAVVDGPGGFFGPYSASTFSTIRQRWNMNVVRLALQDGERNLTEVAKVIRRANDLGLFVVLAIRETRTAASFKTFPDLVFDVSDIRGGAELVIAAIRAMGIRQPIVVAAPGGVLKDPNLIYEISPDYRFIRSERDLEKEFGALINQVPVLANDWDLKLDGATEVCAAIPADPGEAEELVRSYLHFFDRQHVGWTASVFAPGKLITNYRDQDATTIENGWVCGQPERFAAGMGMLVQFHLWSGEMRGLFAVNGSGNLLVPRGGVAIAYGPIMAEKDSPNRRPTLPTSLGKISVKISDCHGKSRFAGLMYASAGWGQVNFVVPSDLAPGPGRITIVREDGTSVSAPTTIADVAPGFWTTFANGRGPAIGFVTRSENGKISTSPIWKCSPSGCESTPIRFEKNRPTRIRLVSTGIRNARTLDDIRVNIGGIPVQAVAYGPSSEPGADDLTVELKPEMHGLGETDVICSVRGELSNVARINLGDGPYRWQIPKGFPKPVIPATNPMSLKKVQLGRYLFYDRRLSVNGTQSCASCHRQELAFSDGQRVATGATGQTHPRNSMSLVNLVYNGTLTWVDQGLHSLEKQALVPMLSEKPVELGLSAVKSAFLKTIASDPVYQSLFQAAFRGETNPYTIENVTKAIAAFERSILSARSPYDRYYYGGDATAISESAKRGELLFFTDPLASCFRCHSGVNFTDDAFHNTGLYSAPDKFRTPTLRNVALTAPYMHDGSIATLEEVIEHYNAGGRAQEHPNIDPRIRKLALSKQNREDLVEFLRSLTDSELIGDPRFANPW